MEVHTCVWRSWGMKTMEVDALAWLCRWQKEIKIMTQNKGWLACCPSREVAGKPVRHSMDQTCPGKDADKPHVVLLCSKDHLSAPSNSGNRGNSLCILWPLHSTTIMPLWSSSWEAGWFPEAGIIAKESYALLLHCRSFAYSSLCLGFSLLFRGGRGAFFSFKIQFNSVVKLLFPCFDVFCFSVVDFQCLSSGTPACRPLSSTPFNEIVLKFLSAKSPSIPVPLTPSAFFTVTTDSPSVLRFFWTLLIELPGFYIRLLNDTLVLWTACCQVPFVLSIVIQHSILSSYHVWCGFCLARID